MIFSVHCYYQKNGSRKAAHKFEGIVFAKDREHASDLVERLLSDYPVSIEGMTNVAGGFTEKSLEQIYDERPELIGITPEQGYIYNEQFHRNAIRKYVGK
jgi:hypothetical protein